MKQLIILPITILFSHFLSLSQMTDEQLNEFIKTASRKELIEKNTVLLLDGAYYQSSLISGNLLNIEPENSNFNYRHGFALLHMSANHNLELQYLIKSTGVTSKNFDMFNAKENSAPYDSYYYLGRCYHLNENIDLAIESYQKYLSLNVKNSELNPKCELFIQHCKNAKEEMKYPKKYELINLGKTINTDAPEYAPVISLDGQALYFTSRRLRNDASNADIKEPGTNMHLEDIYVSYRNQDNSWGTPQIMDFCLPERNEATVAVSADERKIFIYKDDKGNGDIFFSEFQDGRFKRIEPINVPGINSDAWEPHITISADGTEKYFSSDRPGGFGGRDIYRVKRLPNGEWSEPMNLGAKINGPHDEDSPFLAVDNKTLYFSSNGKKSIGGFDIFISIMDEDGIWSDPINLGYPLNSVGDDIYFNTTADGNLGYLSSFRANGLGDKDIYEVNTSSFGMQNISMLKGEIVIAHNQEIPEDLSVTIVCLDCGNENIRTVYPRLRDGNYFSTLPKCHQFELIYKKGSNEFHRDRISTNCDDKYEEVNHRVLMRLDDLSVIPFMKYNLKGYITDFQTKEKIDNALVELIDNTGNVVESINTNNSAEFSSKLLDFSFYGDQINYKIRVSKNGYLTQKFDLDIRLGDKADIIVHYAIDKPSVGVDIAKVLELKPIYFDLDKADIRPDAEVELNKIVEIMNENPSIRIELGSHTDCRGSYSYNMSLSDRRAKASAAYIQKRIDDPKRISGKGYGESKLVNDCACEDKLISECSEEEHQINRRTEFRIIK